MCTTPEKVEPKLLKNNTLALRVSIIFLPKFRVVQKFNFRQILILDRWLDLLLKCDMTIDT